ncbi:unnamed protein product [Effrenium voratum]|uniref:SET domain-containing protein n=1 Tax=Effrenium voratum TaxID=2562239 RepID=A0AA36MPJ6_9DINO|nr:unnamed protein product [Effrenium voratum]
MSDLHILEAFRRYCHPEVVNEFQQLGPENQQVWLNAFFATCHNSAVTAAADRVAERLYLANPQTLDPSDADLPSMLAQMQSSYPIRGETGADPCPLLRALQPHMKLDQSYWADLLGPLRDFLPSWGRKRTRQELRRRHEMGVLHHKGWQAILSQNSDLKALKRSDATTQKPTAFMKSWTSLVPSCFADLPLFMVAKGKVVHCTVIDHPFVSTAIQVLVEDDQGQLMSLQLYNQLPEGAFGGFSADGVTSKFAKGTKVSIAEPFLKIMNDGYRGIRVDAPSDVRVSLVDSDMTSLKTAGNSAFSKGQFDLAKEQYLAALEVAEAEEITMCLANRAQAFLEIDPVEACKDAATTLLLRPAHQKAGLRYAAALKRCAEHWPKEGEEERRSWMLVAKRAATLYPAGAQVEQSVTRQDIRVVLATLLCGFADGLKFYQSTLDFEIFGESAAQCREEANRQYKAGDKLKAITGYTLGLAKAGCAKTIAMLLSNLSEVSLRLRESHNAVAFAVAATRFGVADLSGKLLSRTCRALEQLGERALAMELARVSTDGACAEASKEFLRLPETYSFRTRVYTNGVAKAIVDGAVSNSKPLPEIVHHRIKAVPVAGKGRGVIATEAMESGELLIVAYALSLGLAAKDEFLQITSGRAHQGASTAKLVSRLAYSASSNNEVAWILSQLCAKPGESKETVQPCELVGLSPRWMPLLLQQHCFYPSHERVSLAKPTIDSIITINSHGSRTVEGAKYSGVFPSACLFNHSSDANCGFVSVELADGSSLPEVLAVMTMRAVKEGEELCVRYSEIMPLENTWGIKD